MPSIAFLFWCRACFRGIAVSRKRTEVAFLTLAFASILWYGSNLFVGHDPFAPVAAPFGFAYVAAIGLMLILSRRSNSLPVSLATNFLLFAWVFTYAFPWFGEAP